MRTCPIPVSVAVFFLSVVAVTALHGEEQKTNEKKDGISKAYPYPMDACPVSGKKLTDMGVAFAYEYKGRPLMFCCKSCVHKLEEKPDEYLKKLDEAIIEKQKPTYPLKTCVISGKNLETAVDYVYMNRLVRFCTKECIKKFLEDPKQNMEKLDEASAKPSEEAQKK